MAHAQQELDELAAELVYLRRQVDREDPVQERPLGLRRTT